MTFTLTLRPKSGGPVTVRYATANGTAQAGTDYTVAGGQVTFTPGQTSKTLAIGVKGDTAREDDEVFLAPWRAPEVQLFSTRVVGVPVARLRRAPPGAPISRW